MGRRMRGPMNAPRRQQGVMILEMVIAAFFVLALVGAVSVVAPIAGQLTGLGKSSSAVDSADTIRDALRRDFRGAVRDSIRITKTNDGRTLAEFVPQTGSGIYKQTSGGATSTSACPTGGKGDALAFGEADTCFKSDGVAGLAQATSGMYVSLPGFGAAQFYGSGSAALTSIQLGSTDARIGIAQTTLTSGSTGSVFQVSSAQPVTWECDPAQKTISRITGYGRSQAQPTDFSGATRKTFSTGVDSCSFRIGDTSEWTRTALLLHFDGEGTAVTDSSPDPKTVSIIGSAVQSTEAGWFGNGARFTAGRVSVAWTSAQEPGSADFTVDFQLRGAGAQAGVVASAEPSGGGYGPWRFVRGADGVLRFFSSSNATSWNVANGVALGAVSADYYRHFAAARSGSTIRLFADGAVVATASVSGNLSPGTGGVSVGAALDGSSPYAGDVDEFRLLVGRAAWISGFDVPTSAYKKPDDAFVASVSITEHGAPSLVSVAVEPRNGNN